MGTTGSTHERREMNIKFGGEREESTWKDNIKMDDEQVCRPDSSAQDSGFTKGGKFFYQLNNYQLLKNSTAWTQLSPTNSLFLNLTALNQMYTLYRLINLTTLIQPQMLYL